MRIVSETISLDGKAMKSCRPLGDKLSGYTWIVTKDEVGGEVSDAIGKIGPPGAPTQFRFDRVIAGGAEFRLFDSEGRARFSGFILGRYKGPEPLLEYGYEFGCIAIAYKRNGRWVPMPVETVDYSNTSIQHFKRSA